MSTDSSTPKIENPQMPELLQKLDSLEKALLANDPKMPNHLKEIHKYLIQFEELAHLLSEEQIAKIMDAQQRVTGIRLAAETTSGKGNASRGNLKKITANDL